MQSANFKYVSPYLVVCHVTLAEPDLQVTLKNMFIIQYCLYYFYSFHVLVPIMST